MTVETAALRDALASAVRADRSRPATEDDAIDGAQPSLVVEPQTVEEAASVLGRARELGARVALRGGGTKLGRGNIPAGLDLVLSTRRLDRLIEHAAGDMTATVQCGMTLRALQDRLAEAGQMLALDPPFAERATIGGLVATNDSGPLRLRYGGIRDLLIGVTVVRTDGVIAKGGGKVVKNVAGYDLPKLFTGSLGTLGLIAEVTFRLHPLPQDSGSLALRAETPEAAGALILEVLGSTLVPTGLALHWAGGEGCDLLLRFAGIRQSVAAQLEQARALAAARRLVARTLGADEAVTAWHDDGEGPWSGAQHAVVARCGVLPTEIPTTVRALAEIAERRGLQARAAIQAHGLGLVRLEPDADASSDEALIEATSELRERIAPRDGTLVLMAAPLAVKRRVDVWGPASDAVPVMRRVKALFDPDTIMNPGRFLTGIER